ncbi:hypothetical protein BH11PLA1_BH11PLA1_01390 [soil metagenome]
MTPLQPTSAGVDDHGTDGHSGPADAAGGPIVPLRIIALDDDADFREYMLGVLRAEGHDARAVAEQDELLAAIEAAPPEVVLLDIKMGRLTGEQVLAELRRRWPRLCVIIVTGFPSLASMRATFKQDVFDYLAKPFALADLRAVLRQAAVALGLGLRPQDRLRTVLGKHIRLARNEKGWTLKDLSERSGLSVSQLSSIERGSHLPSLESLIDIAAALGQHASGWLAAAQL